MAEAAKVDILQERRKNKRLNMEFEIDALFLSGNRAGDQVRGQIISLSKGGAGIIFSSEVTKGTQLGLTIFSEEGESTCSVDIVWSKEIDGRIVYGVKIIKWSYIEPALEHLLASNRSPD